MYIRCDYPLQILFVYFLILPSLLHPSILFNCFYTCLILCQHDMYMYMYMYVVRVEKLIILQPLSRGWHYIGICTSTRNRGQSEVKQSRRNSEGGQTVKQGIEGSLEMVKAAPGARWAWLMLDSQGSRLDFWSGQGVKLKNLMGQDLDPGRGWKYRCLCSVTPLTIRSDKNFQNQSFINDILSELLKGS